jgi:hypothetical protein
MSAVIAARDLEKAAANLGRMEQYFAARRSWRASSADRFQALRTGITGLGEIVQDLVQIHQVPVATPPPTEVAALPTDDLDDLRVAKFTAFAAQLKMWFEAAHDQEVEPDAKPLLASVFASLASLVSHLNGIQVTEAAPAASADHAPASEAQPPPPASSIPPPVAINGAPNRIELFDCDETPIIQTFQGEPELTDSAKESIRGFLAAYHINYGKYQIQKFEEKVLRWVESTPDGQMLVLKIGGLSGKPEPYPSYVRRSVGDDVYAGSE